VLFRRNLVGGKEKGGGNAYAVPSYPVPKGDSAIPQRPLIRGTEKSKGEQYMIVL